MKMNENLERWMLKARAIGLGDLFEISEGCVYNIPSVKRRY